MIDRRLIENFDWKLFGLTLIICVFGLITLYSAVSSGDRMGYSPILLKQMIWYSFGLIVFLTCISFDYRGLDRWANVIYLLVIILLVLVLIHGKLAGGSKRWLVVGPITVQPSEICKVAVVIVLSRYYAKNVKSEGLVLRDLVPPLIYILIPFMLVVKQPDLGTGLLIVLIAGSITMFVKIYRSSFILIVISAIVTVPMVWFFLKEYQKQRIKSFLNPELDPLGAGYHIIQSKIAIGSGMMHGKGFLQGSQNMLSFLPEQHTDFIFSIFAEEWGFIGSFLLIMLFFLIIIRGLNIAYNCRDSFGAILAMGLTSIIFWQVLINIGMVMGLMPVVGVPLPFISYGGSSVITMTICAGLLINISMRRFMLD